MVCLRGACASASESQLEGFLAQDGLVARYVRWRARAECGPSGGDGLRQAERLYAFAQMLVHEQLTALARRAQAHGCGLYLDLPVGVVRDGFDAHRFEGMYARGVSVGAPPDAYFPSGQVWGFAPMLPLAAAQSGHEELVQAAGRHLRYARALRVDHVMGLWRLYWVPDGHEAQDGAYVRYDAQGALDRLAELSWRYEATFVGEDLGTVPPEVERQMAERGMLGMTAAQYDGGAQVLQPADGGPRRLACLNTHDMPPFAGYLAGRDVALGQALGLLDASFAGKVLRERRQAVERLVAELGVDDAAAMLRALVDRLCGSPAPIVLVTLEDLWLETEPVNVPGITSGYPCWRRPMRRRLEQVVADRSLSELLAGWSDRLARPLGASRP
ncbi:MAG: hypothetical protein KatS3mg103_0830 [Phycisphaerales bacterium]|nr:MAG: hypothetical protein KatS3mg103_0830 [Phycisphaerales bacterium]